MIEYFKFCLIIGICIKLKADKSKVFINLCHHADIPPPEDITKDELIEVLNSKDPEKYCVPLSIGTEHKETDKCKSVNVNVTVNVVFIILYIIYFIISDNV